MTSSDGNITVLVFVLIITAILVCAGFSFIQDWWRWNNGKCRKTGKDWKWYGTDSNNGDRVYRTDDGQEWITISWKVDPEKYHP